MAPGVINLEEERRKRSNKKPSIPLIGVRSNAKTVLTVTMSSAPEKDKDALFEAMISGTYRDMIVELASRYCLVSAK